MLQPDFNRLVKVFMRQKTDYPVLFEYFMNMPLLERMAKCTVSNPLDNFESCKVIVKAFYNAGYDYVTIPSRFINPFSFPAGEIHRAETISLNEGNTITDWESFENYQWQNPDNFDYSILNKLKNILPEGMKIIVPAPGGVLENVIQLVGFERLCFMIFENEALVDEIFKQVGSRLVQFYDIVCAFDAVGAVISNDDWGFKTQTMLSPDMLRQYVFPFHRQIVQTVHNHSKYAVLHSCGNLTQIFEEIVDDLKYDAKHSFEDEIISVENFYAQWGQQIAIVGGIDMDFLARSSESAIYQRASKLVEMCSDKGGYALGSGNSIPQFIPAQNYLAMIRPVLEQRGIELKVEN